MPIFWDLDSSSDDSAACQQTTAQRVRIGVVNNMPNGAMQATECQFFSLLGAAAEGIDVHLSIYALPEVPRSDSSRRYVQASYYDIERLWDSQLDGLIVTGMEPLAANLADEPYWGSLTRVLEWAEDNTHSSVWSCLAAQAAVFYLDGITRRRLTDKRCGVFDCTQASDHDLTAGAPAVLRVPHSRWNDIAESDLARCGYRILTRATDGGVDSFVKQRNSLFIFFQGHLEYEKNTLLLEYRRDIGRYLRGERDTYPRIPQGYFDANTAAALAALEEQAIRDRCVDVLGDFPMALAEKNLVQPWRTAAIRIYRNWLAYLGTQKERQREELAPERWFAAAD